MFGPINPQNEEIRAQRTLSSFTEHEKAIDVFAGRPQGKRARAQTEAIGRAANTSRNPAQSIMRVFQAIKLNRQPVVDEPTQHPVGSPRQATPSGC